MGLEKLFTEDIAGFIAQPSAPVDTSLLWLDTDETAANGPTGPTGPTGATGPSNFVAQSSEPETTNVLWLDTDEAAANGPTGPTGPSGDWSTPQTLRSITGATDTPTSTDSGKLITVDTSSGSVTITINNSLGLSAGQKIDFIWVGAATSVTFSASNVTLNGTPGLSLTSRYAYSKLICLATNTYVLTGDLKA